MNEMIVTMVCAATEDEPAHTEVTRIEFDTFEHMAEALVGLTEGQHVINSEQLHAY